MKPIEVAVLPSEGEHWRVLTLSDTHARTARRILVVPGASVTATTVDAVGRTDAQARAAALASLAQELAATSDATVCAIGAPRGGRRLAFVASKSDLASWISEAGRHGFAPDLIVPDFALLPEPAMAEASTARRVDWLVRTETAGFACQDDLLLLLLGDLQPREFDFEASAIAAVRSGVLATLPAFVPEAPSAASKGGRRSFAIVGLAAAVALMIAAAIPWVDAIRSDMATRDLRRQSEAIARAALPDARRIVNPLAQLREAALPRARGKAALGAAAAVFEGLARSPGVEITRIELDAEGSVHASLTMPNAGLLQPLRDHLTANRLELIETPGESQLNNLPIALTVKAAS